MTRPTNRELARMSVADRLPFLLAFPAFTGDPEMVDDSPQTLRGFLGALRNGILSGIPPCCVWMFAIEGLRSRAPIGRAFALRSGHSRDCWALNYQYVPCRFHRWLRPPRWFCQCGRREVAG